MHRCMKGKATCEAYGKIFGSISEDHARHSMQAQAALDTEDGSGNCQLRARSLGLSVGKLLVAVDIDQQTAMAALICCVCAPTSSVNGTFCGNARRSLLSPRPTRTATHSNYPRLYRAPTMRPRAVNQLHPLSPSICRWFGGRRSKKPDEWLPAFSKAKYVGPQEDCITYSASLFIEDLRYFNPKIHLCMVSATGAVTPWVVATNSCNPLSGWKKTRLEASDQKNEALGISITNACKLKGTLQVPKHDFGPIGAVLARVSWNGIIKLVSPIFGIKPKELSLYIECLDLHKIDQSNGESHPQELIIPIHSYVFEQQGTRLFTAKTFISQKTPKGLKPYRSADLEVTKGLRTSIALNGKSVPEPPFQIWDRVYQYDVYNDLGGDPELEDDQRPNLGGNFLPYPRRIKTGRPLISNTGKEQPLKDNQTPYLPKFELFTPIRQRGFQGNTFRSTIRSALTTFDATGRGPASLDFDSFREVKSWFHVAPLGRSPALAPLSVLLKAVRLFFRIVESVLKIKLLGFSFWLSPAADITKNVFDILDEWKGPKVYEGRADMWRSDQEYGRHAVAGQNPVTLAAVTSLEGTNFTSATVPATLTGGVPIEKLVKKARVDPTSCCLFQQDYHTVIADYLHKVNSAYGEGKRVLTATRCLFYADSTTKKLVPVAIQIQRTADVASRDVFTPYDAPGVWMLAKMFHANNDSSVHQVVSHWLRSHASMEPFILASRRQLSQAHPLNRVLQKHTTYTLQLNANARAGLINAGGVIECTFTPGKYAMEVGARVYGALWRFEKEALPNDLVARGMAVPDKSAPSGVRLLDTVDYPFATDALELWQLLEGWFTDYIDMYYSSDEDVVEDNELMAWWDDIKTQGHPDIKEGWPELDGRSSLAKIVTTIVYIASAHHAAVNFGQYDFSGLLLNRSSKVRKPFPKRDDAEFTHLASEADHEFVEDKVLDYLARPVDLAIVLAVLQVLSTHDEKESYLGDHDPWVIDPPAVQRYKQFANDMADFESRIKERNVDLALVNRCGEHVLPYTLLIPSSTGGITCRGVPNSISI